MWGISSASVVVSPKEILRQGIPLFYFFACQKMLTGIEVLLGQKISVEGFYMHHQKFPDSSLPKKLDRDK